MRKLILTITLLLLTFVSFNVVFGDTLAQESQFNNITIFIRFNDEDTYTAPFGLSYYDDMLNSTDSESLKNYYLEASYGTLTIDSFIPSENGNIIFYTDIYDRNYFEPYGDDNPQGVRDSETGDREHHLIQRAINYVDENNLVPDELDLDVNEDGMIDSLTFMISGEDTGWNTLLWPHKWELYTFYSDTYGFNAFAPSINGVHAYIYTWELLGNSQDYEYQVSIGILAHETFHLLGAPDLYHYYQYLDVEPVGDWGLMESVGPIPSHMLGYMKEHYAGWIPEVNEITDSGVYTLYPLQDSLNNVYKIYTGVTDQWIYLEYRDDDGLYESTLPYSGLLVYRVNLALVGNESGSYDGNGDPTDEVFIFRPEMDDTTDPIIIAAEGNVDGNIDRAALTDFGSFPDAIGLGTDIPIFASDGTILNIGIFNVVESNGFITFEVFLEPQVELVSDDYSLRGRDLILYDSELMDYEVEVANVPAGMDVYYTLDGSVPTLLSDQYIPGTTIDIDSRNNLVSISLYDGTELISTSSREFVFDTVIESYHNPYQNNVSLHYYFDFGNDAGYSLSFDGRSEVEDDYDYIYVDVNDTNEIFTGTEMRDYYNEFYSDELLIRFETDEYVNQYFGFLVVLEPESNVSLNMLGYDEYTMTVFEDFQDPGAELNGYDKDSFTLEVLGEVDTDLLGTYTLTYVVKDVLGEVVIEEDRIVHVIDDVTPVVELNGSYETEIEAGSEYIDQYIIFSDNYDQNPTVEVSGDVDTSKLGSNIISYTVTDASGNVTEIQRIIHVVDTQAPTGTISAGIDTITVGQEWIDGGVEVIDNLTTSFDIVIEGTVDVNTVGYYEIKYDVSDSSGNVITLTRIVSVIDELIPVPEVVCNDMVTTLSTDQQLVLLPCYLSGEVMQVDYSDVTMTEGIHEILYYIEINGIRYEHSIYYYVYASGTTINEVAYLERREEI